jgi:2-oxoglutarate dehydrogenase E1 component
MSPKSMLRHPQAISALEEFTQTGFREVIDYPESKDPSKFRRVILCSGKVYYDLVAERAARGKTDVAIVRVEQLYPWPAAQLEAVLKRYSKATEFVWAQEEPRNMGAWTFVFSMWSGALDDFNSRVGGKPLRYAGRGIAASPAVGSPKIHELELKSLLEQAFV